MNRAYFNVAIVRSFSVGVTIFSPKLNGLCFEIVLACFLFRFDSKGKIFFKGSNFWNG